MLKFSYKFDKEIEKVDYMELKDWSTQEKIEEIRKEYIKYKLMFDTFWQQAFLRKYNEVDWFIQNTSKILKNIINNVGIDKSKFEPKEEFLPWNINVEKAIKLIGNFKIESK